MQSDIDIQMMLDMSGDIAGRRPVEEWMVALCYRIAPKNSCQQHLLFGIWASDGTYWLTQLVKENSDQI